LSIRSRLLLLILFATLIPVVAAVMQFLRLRESEVADAQRDMATATRRVALALQDTVRATSQLHYGLSRASDLSTSDRAACSAFLANVLKEHPQYTGILTIKPDGNLFCDSLRSGRNLNLTDRRYFQEALNSADPLAVEPAFGRLTGSAVLQIAYAARRDSGETTFVLLASLDLNKYMQLAARSLPRETAVISLIDGKGTILTWHPGGEKLRGTSIADTPLFRFAREQKSGDAGEFTEAGETPRIWTVGAMPAFPESGLRVMVGVSKADLLATANQSIRQALWVLGIVSLLVFAGAWALMEMGIRRQVARIMAAADRHREGDFKARIGASYLSGEIGGLMRALDDAFERISRLSRIHAVLSQINAAIVRVRDRQNLLKEVCRIAVERGGFGVAWIGMMDDKTLDVMPAACAGAEAESLMAASSNSARADSPRGQGLVGRALREARPVFSNDLIAEATRGGVRRQEALRRGYRSLIALPLMAGDKVTGCLSLFAREGNAFDDEEVMLLSEVANNISFALDLIRKSEALAQTEKKLDDILDTLQEVVWSMEVDSGRIVYINSAVRQLTRRANVEFLAEPRLWRKMVHRDDRASVREAIRKLLREDRLTHEFRIVLADGEERTVESSARVRRDDAGKVAFIDGIISDITARKQAEQEIRRSNQRFELVVRATNNAVWDWDFAQNTLWWNDGFTSLFGYAPEEIEPGPESWTLRIHPDEVSRVTDEIHAVIDGPADFWSDEYRFRRHDGTYADIFDRGYIMRDASGKAIRMIGAMQDITSRKQAELALRRVNDELEDKVVERTVDLERARREAEEANRAKSTFLATMSHEIRTPMNGVIGMIDVLHQTSLQGDQVEMVDLIRESAFSLLGIINDILDFSKIEAGKLDIEREAFALADVVEGVGSLLTGMADKKDVIVTLYADPAIPARVLGDSLRLRQILINLVNNAIKFSSGQSQTGQVSVRALLAEQTPQQVVVDIRVADNGIGMDEETQARLFTAFTQADASTTRRFGGTGLGLAIANHLAKLMGGSIGVQSALGAGATFSVRLPFPTVAAEPDAIEPDSEVAGLDCVVIGTGGGLADDLSAYLKHARAQVRRVSGLADAPAPQADRDDRSVWIIDASSDAQPQLRDTVRARIDSDARLAVLLIERGKRRRPREAGPGLLVLDNNCLNRRSFLRIVAAAAGRTSLEAPTDESRALGRNAVVAPSREEALKRGQLILIAEDNETNQKVIVRQLALLGYTADVAGNGREALRRWRSGDYALLLTDLHMPHMDGYELTEAIRAEEKDGRRIPIIALTANALKDEAEHCRVVGMDDYRSKPSPLAELKAVLDKWLPNRSAASAPVPEAKAVPVNVEVLKALVGDDPDMVREFLQDFRGSAGRIAKELRAACVAGQMKEAAAAAHKLKSSSHAVGAHALGGLCAAMEGAGKAADAEALALLVPRFDSEWIQVERYLDDFISEVRETLPIVKGESGYDR